MEPTRRTGPEGRSSRAAPSAAQGSARRRASRSSAPGSSPGGGAAPSAREGSRAEGARRPEGEDLPPGGGADASSAAPPPLMLLVDLIRSGLPRDLQEPFLGFLREVLMALRALIDRLLERLDSPARERRVEDIPIE